MPASTIETLTEPQMADFRRDGFIVVRGLFSGDEARAVRETFMEMGKNGPVEGLSEVRRSKVDGSVGGYDPNDPLARYPRMMHPHNHPDKPVGSLAMKFMTDARVEAVLAQLMGEAPYA